MAGKPADEDGFLPTDNVLYDNGKGNDGEGYDGGYNVDETADWDPMEPDEDSSSSSSSSD